MTSALVPPSTLSPPFSARLGTTSRRVGRRSLYLFTGFPVALAAFVLMVTGLSLSVGLLITVVGLLMLTATVFIARGFAAVERARLVNWMDREAVSVNYREPTVGDGWIGRAIVPLRDPQSWRDVAYALVVFPVAVVAWSIAVVWWSVAVGGLTYVLWGWVLPSGPDVQDLPELIGLGSGYATRLMFWTLAGAVFAVTLPVVISAVSRTYAAVGDALLLAPARRRRQLDALVAGRHASRTAQGSSLRRLERDIHDGPQQRLVRLSMDLGRAHKKASETSPELAVALDDARRQTQDALDELRALSRGIAPPILADRGLHRALQELAVRCPVPVDCTVDLAGVRLAAHIESSVYFVASEALTNTTKHSRAAHGSLNVGVENAMVTVRIADDGHGGATMIDGHGLAGLADRVRGVDGWLDIDSPEGGPTVITAEIPCES